MELGSFLGRCFLVNLCMFMFVCVCLTDGYNKSRGKYVGCPPQSGERSKEDVRGEEEGPRERKGAAYPKFFAEIIKYFSLVCVIYQYSY